MTAVRLGVVTDVHLVFAGSSKEGSLVAEPEGWNLAATDERLLAVAERFAREQVDGVVVLGDISHHGDDATLDRALAAFARLRGGLWAAPGNHDVAASADALARALRRAGRADGEALPDGRRLAVLEIESADWIMSCRARSAPPVESWGEDLVLLASHYPLAPRAGAASGGPVPPDHLVDGRELLAPLLARTAPTLVLSGHLHVRDAYATGPVLQLLFPSLVESAECSILELESGPGSVRLRRTAVGVDGAPPSRDESWELDGERWRPLA